MRILGSWPAIGQHASNSNISVDQNGSRRRSHNGCRSGAVAVLTELMGEASPPCAAKLEAPTAGGWTVGRRRVEY
jgi:hypothetical protein